MIEPIEVVAEDNSESLSEIIAKTDDYGFMLAQLLLEKVIVFNGTSSTDLLIVPFSDLPHRGICGFVSVNTSNLKLLYQFTRIDLESGRLAWLVLNQSSGAPDSELSMLKNAGWNTERLIRGPVLQEDKDALGFYRQQP